MGPVVRRPWQQQQGMQHKGTHAARLVAWALILVWLQATFVWTAAQLSPEDCYITEAQLGPADGNSCDSICREETLEALQGIYEGLNGSTWNFDFESYESGQGRYQGGWMNCQAGGCTATNVPREDEDTGPMPAYCCWQGVLCCHEHSIFTDRQRPCARNSVIMLQLRAGNITGKLENVMDHMQTLHRHGMVALDLSRNQITGPLPADVAQLSNLQALLLGANNMTGSVPASLSNLTQLKQLDLEFNFFDDRLTAEQLCPTGSNLTALMLRANNFSGPLDLTRCGSLVVVDLQDNGFSGRLPVGRSNMLLHVLRARNNNFSGSIPDDFWELPQLLSVDLSNNRLTGTLAETIGTTSFLTNLNLGGNRLRGTIPRNMTTSSQLTNLDLSNNPWIVGSIPSFRWMLGLQSLDLSNTRIKGRIPLELGNLPFLMAVDLRNTLMTCCDNYSDAYHAQQQYSPGNASGHDSAHRLLPPFLQFNDANKRSPIDQRMPSDPFLRKMMATGQDLMCPAVMRRPNTNPDDKTVYRPANLSAQQWLVDPEYYWFFKCDCAQQGDEMVRDHSALEELWCEDEMKWIEELGKGVANTTHTCAPMSLQVCQPRSKALSSWHYILISFAALAMLCLLVMLASLFVSLCLARTGKVRRQLEWWRKHLSGMPQHGKMSIVVTDIEGYSDLFKRCPEPMYDALTLHNNVIRRAKYANCGSTVQQEGDSYTLVFHDAMDAVAFCLQAQLALMEVPWPEGLYDDSSNHQQLQGKSGNRPRSKGRIKLTSSDSTRRVNAVSSLLPSGPSSWLRKSKSALKQSASTNSVAIGAPVSPPSPTASENLGMLPNSSLAASAGEAAAVSTSVLPATSSSMAWRGSQHMSRARMLELFSRVTGSGGGTCEASLFNGLRVRMGVVTGVVEGSPEPSAPTANIMNSALYKLALDVSDAGSGGQVLVDETTFIKIKEDLRPLGAVGPSGINYNKLAERVSLFHLLCLGSLCARRSRLRDVDEAVVLDMGQFELPVPSLEKKTPMAQGPPNLAGMLVRASMKLTGWGHSIGSGTHTPSISTLPEDGELHTYPPPPTLLLPGGMLHDPAAGHGGPTRPSPRGQRTSPHGDHTASAGASSPQRGGGGGRTVAGWATPDADVAQKLSVGGAGSSCGGDVVPHKRVRLIQVLSPSLVGRAHVWGNKLAVRGTWTCVDAPYFEAPGAMEAPLGITPARGHSLPRVATDSAPLSSGMSLTPGGTSFVSVAGSQQSAPQLPLPPTPLLQQQSSHEQQLSLPQQQQWDQQQQQQQPPQVLQVDAVQGRCDSTDSSVSSPSMASVLGAAGGTSSSSSRAVSLWPSIREEACQAAPAEADEVVLQQQQLLLVRSPGQDDSSSPPVELAAGQPAANGPVAHTAGVPEASAAAAAARLLRQPIPPVTMVFMLVEGAKLFGQRRKQLVKEVHAELSEMLMLALKHVPGGYMCRMQEGDLKYMVAFSSACAALEWCLLVQEASMYLSWPLGSLKVPQLRPEFDSRNQLVFRGPRIKMGVCEGVPQSIIPNHEGRADYHGSSINQAARFMDAAAHGGQIACELDLALAVVQHWNSRGASFSNSSVPAAPPAQAAPAAAAATGGEVQDYTSSQQQRQMVAEEQLRVMSAPVLDHPGTDDAEGPMAGGQGPEAARRKSAGSGEAAAKPSTLMSLDSSMDQAGHKQHQQQPGGLPASQLQSPGLSAAPSIAAADDDSSLLPVSAAEADLCSGIAGEQVEPSSATAVSAAAGGASSRSSFFFGGGPGDAGSTNSTRFAWLFKGAGHSSCTQQQHGSPASHLQPPQPAAAAEAEQAPRLFQLAQDQVQRAPVAVEVYQLGLFKFKGSPQPLAMVDVTLASLAGRLPLLPKDPPKGKGGRVAAKEGLVTRCEAHLPVLAQLYRARVPAHVLERNEFIAAVHPTGPGSPRRQVNAALRSASMPTRSYSQHSRSPCLPGQQQQRMQDLQLAAMEGGLIGSSSSPCSPVPSPKPLQATNRSSSFTAKLFSKQSRQPSMANGTPWSPGGGDTSKGAAGVSSNGPSSVDVV